MMPIMPPQTRPSVLDLNCSDGFPLPTVLTALEARILGICAFAIFLEKMRERGRGVLLSYNIV